MEQLWQRVAEGRHTALLEIVPGDPPPGLGLRIVRVRCDVPEATLGPLVEARSRVERLVGGGPPLLDQARTLVFSGIRRRLLGDVMEAPGDSDFIEACNRLARSAEHRWALVFDSVESADRATLDVLRRVVARPDALRVALVLSFRVAIPVGAPAELLAAVRAAGGPEAVLRTPEGDTAGQRGVDLQALPLRELPADVRRVLRAGSLVGSGFEAGLVAALLGLDPLDVLEALQRAADAGVPLEDRGEGRFHLPQGAVDGLRRSILPSLARVWHRRLATLLSEEALSDDPMELHGGRRPKTGGSRPPAPGARDAAGPATVNERRIPGVAAAGGARAEDGAARAASAVPSRSVNSARPPAASVSPPRPPPPPGVPAVAPTPRPPPSGEPAEEARDGAGPASVVEPDLTVPVSTANPAADTLRPPPSAEAPAPTLANAQDASPTGASPHPSPPPSPASAQVEHGSRNAMATPPPGAPPWSYSDLFARGSDVRRSDPPESFLLEGPPDSLDAPIPGPVRLPRDLGPISGRGAGDERGVGSVRSVRGFPSRGPVSVAEAAAGGPGSTPAWRSGPPTSTRSARWLQHPPPSARAAWEALRPAGLPTFPGSFPSGPASSPAASRQPAATSRPFPAASQAPERGGAQRPVTAGTGAGAGASRRSDDARAAAHLNEAGDLEEAARRYCVAAAQATAIGAHGQAIGHGQKALALLDSMPTTPTRRRLRITALTAVARVQWQAAGPDPSFTLAGALEVLDAARALLTPGDPPELHTEVALLIASVCYDLGDLRSLERALGELTASSRLLLDGGDAIGAARLLNDQAAVYVRMGDPVRAAHLLSESRRVFEERAGLDPVARVEIAETDHLFARIPLHVAARPGREEDALTMGLDHAIAAERAYKQIGANRELARVWETMGRLELRKGRLERAAQRLASALEVQHGLGDLVGLARSTAALSEVLAAKGQPREALLLLADSVAMNLEKGSPLGLAFNRRALHALTPSVSLQGEAAEVLRKLATQLSSAESVLGRLKLPGEHD